MAPQALSSEKSEKIKIFQQRAEPTQSTLTLGGTGPNGSIHTLFLQALGHDYVRKLSKINILSASSFAFFIFVAKDMGLLNLEHFKHYDRWVRARHNESFSRIVAHFWGMSLPETALYTQLHLRETISYLFHEDFLRMTLRDFEHNVHFWVYCSRKRMNLSLSAERFPDMRVWEAISAASSIPFVHGEFEYKGGSFRDGVFSPQFKGLRQSLQKTSNNHLYLNYKRNAERKNLLLVRNTDSKTPMLELLCDYLMFICNIPNRRINKTHRLVLSQS